jgi:nucleoside-diphosphate-sugar epimerase
VKSQLVLVTGASGRLGRATCSALQEAGWRVRALVHRHPSETADEQVEGSLEDPGTLVGAVDGVDAIVHAAALTHARRPRDYDRVNTLGTANLLEAAGRQPSARFLFVSTRAISPKGGAYSRSKHAAERAVMQSGLPYVIVRLPEVYGAGSAEGVDRIIGLARSGRLIPLVGAASERVCPVHVDDVVPPLLRALESDSCLRKSYTLAGDCLTLAEFAQACVTAFDSKSRIVELPLAAVRMLATAGRFLPLPVYPDQVARLTAPKPELTPEAITDLGFAPRSLRVGLEALAVPRS